MAGVLPFVLLQGIPGQIEDADSPRRIPRFLCRTVTLGEIVRVQRRRSPSLLTSPVVSNQVADGRLQQIPKSPTMGIRAEKPPDIRRTTTSCVMSCAKSS